MKKKILFLFFIFALCMVCSKEISDWSQAEAQNTLASYEKYLVIHPNSKYETQARERVDVLKAIQAAMDERTKSSRTELESCLERYPQESDWGKVEQVLEELEYRQVQALGTVASCDNYMRKYPQGRFSKEIAEQRLHLLNERKPLFRDIESIGIEVETPGAIFFEIEDACKNLIGAIGLDPVIEKGQPADATLKITASTRALGSSYPKLGPPKFDRRGNPLPSAGTYQYTGAEVSGQISLEKKRGVVYQKKFHGKILPPEKIKARSDRPYDAPFASALYAPGSFGQAILEALEKTFGRSCIYSALKAGNELLWPWTRARINSLGQEAIAPLVRAFEFENKGVKDNILAALRDQREAAIDYLDSQITNEDPFLRASAARILGGLEFPETVPSLIQALTDENKSVRLEAARALGKIKDPRGLDPLIARLQDEDLAVCIVAALSLGEMKRLRGVDQAIKRLLAAADGNKETISIISDIWAAIAEITGRYYISEEDWGSFESWWERNKKSLFSDK